MKMKKSDLITVTEVVHPPKDRVLPPRPVKKLKWGAVRTEKEKPWMK
jgi:hypothetical protein